MSITLRFYISPFFIIRYYLKKDIKYFYNKYRIEGKILDVGCGQKPYKSIFINSEYKGIDFKSYSKNKDSPKDLPNYYFNDKYLNDFTLPFEDAEFDHTISFQVLEHHKKPDKMICEMARVTKSKGYIMVSFPFLYPLHEEPNDYQRITEYKFQDICKDFNCEVVEIRKQGSIFSVISILANEQLNTFASKGVIPYLFAAVAYSPLLLYQYLCLLLDYSFKSNKIFMNYLVLAKKNEKDSC